jgi:histidyl-tRNA synthetase
LTLFSIETSTQQTILRNPYAVSIEVRKIGDCALGYGVGEDEVAAGTAVIKDLESGEQQSVPLDLCTQTLLTALAAASQSPKE